MSRVIQVLGYPTRKRLYNGIEEDNSPPKTKTQRKKYNNTSQHPSVELKLNTIHRCFELGENVQLVSEEIRYSRTSILLEPGGINHSESSRNNQSELIRNSQCTCLADRLPTVIQRDR